MSPSYDIAAGTKSSAPAPDIVPETVQGTVQCFGRRRQAQGDSRAHSVAKEAPIESSFVPYQTEAQASKDGPSEDHEVEEHHSKTPTRSTHPARPINHSPTTVAPSSSSKLILQRDFYHPRNIEKYIGPHRLFLNPAYSGANQYYHGQRRTSNITDEDLLHNTSEKRVFKGQMLDLTNPRPGFPSELVGEDIATPESGRLEGEGLPASDGEVVPYRGIPPQAEAEMEEPIGKIFGELNSTMLRPGQTGRNFDLANEYNNAIMTYRKLLRETQTHAMEAKARSYIVKTGCLYDKIKNNTIQRKLN
ncbi:hypothetical protein BJ875DRAFT_520921 [Amylocarpus encephaloides]|uniref:Uncharacterized protein n=1 Tax=Amylocarpus encephaloides TaxID=45428 RepID=A0A9P7YB27_9HELO|nr:hypothetical protein BJ875DRAFT_520921 [Amylocarpus encephaloides]